MYISHLFMGFLKKNSNSDFFFLFFLSFLFYVIVTIPG